MSNLVTASERLAMSRERLCQAMREHSDPHSSLSKTAQGISAPAWGPGGPGPATAGTTSSDRLGRWRCRDGGAICQEPSVALASHTGPVRWIDTPNNSYSRCAGTASIVDEDADVLDATDEDERLSPVS